MLRAVITFLLLFSLPAATRAEDAQRIESIVFKGNETPESLLLRELPFEEGDILDPAAVSQGVRNLVNLGYFGSITEETLPGSAEGLVAVVFTVQEGPIDLGFGVESARGYSPQTGVLEDPHSAPVRLRYRNLPGPGQSIGMDLSATGFDRQLVSLSFSAPSLLGMPWSWGVSAGFEYWLHTDVLQDVLLPVFTDDQYAIAAPDPFSSQADWDSFIQTGQSIPSGYLMSYDSWEVSISVTGEHHVRIPAGRISISGGIRSALRFIDYDSLSHRAFELGVRQGAGKWVLLNSFYPTLSLDGRDYVMNPTTGYFLSQGIEYAGGLLFGERHFIRTDSVMEGYLPLLGPPQAGSGGLVMVLAAHTAFSAVLPQLAFFSASTGAPPAWGVYQPTTELDNLLYVDRISMGRGWRFGYGQALWENKLELRTLVWKDVLWAVGFFDAAALWATPAYIVPLSLDPFVFSAGIGLRLTARIAPLRFYLARGFRIPNGVLSGRAPGPSTYLECPSTSSSPGGVRFFSPSEQGPCCFQEGNRRLPAWHSAPPYLASSRDCIS